MDDFGTQLHWSTQVRGNHCLGLYGYAEGYGFIEVLAQAIDFSEIPSNPSTLPIQRI